MSEEQKNGTKRSWLRSLFKPLPALFTALAVALIGLFGQKIITDANRQQVLHEALNRHMEAEISFRREMFGDLFSNLLTEINEISDRETLELTIVKLELLSINFSEFLSLGPIFRQLDNSIDGSVGKDTEHWRLEAAKFKSRIRNIARRSINSQIAGLDPYAKSKIIRVPNTALTRGSEYIWPDDQIKEFTGSTNITEEQLIKKMNRYGSIQMDAYIYNVEIIFNEVDLDKRTVRVRLAVDSSELKNVEEKIIRSSAAFDLSHFSFPIVDNMRLPNNHKIALVLDKMNADHMEVLVFLFNAQHVYVGDNPILNTAIRELTVNE